MAGPFSYYQYTVNDTGNFGVAHNGLLTSAGTLVSVTETDGFLTDGGAIGVTGGNNVAADTFTIGATTYTSRAVSRRAPERETSPQPLLALRTTSAARAI